MTKEHAIVDACVAASVGNPTHEKFVGAREIIDYFSDGPVGVFMTDDLLAEWRRHASRFMKSWLANMVARGRTRHEKDKRISDFRKALLRVPENEGRVAMLKDAHLVEAAIWFQLGVLSLDDKQRKYLQNLVQYYPLVGKVQWFNPASDQKMCMLWLQAGCREVSVATIAQS
jgi:hypothetical protein